MKIETLQCLNYTGKATNVSEIKQLVPALLRESIEKAPRCWWNCCGFSSHPFCFFTYVVDGNWFSIQRKIVGKFAFHLLVIHLSFSTCFNIIVTTPHMNKNSTNTIEEKANNRLLLETERKTQFSHVNFSLDSLRRRRHRCRVSCQMLRWRVKIAYLTLTSFTLDTWGKWMGEWDGKRQKDQPFCQSNRAKRPEIIFLDFPLPCTIGWKPFFCSHAKLTIFTLTRTRLLFNWICPQIYSEMVI